MGGIGFGANVKVHIVLLEFTDASPTERPTQIAPDLAGLAAKMTVRSKESSFSKW
jgi:hypothetical protein